MASGWRSILEKLRPAQSPLPSVSFVFLMREYEPISDKQLLSKAHSAYDGAKPNVLEVLKERTPHSRVLRMENFFFSFHEAQQTYSRSAIAEFDVVECAWNEHTCWRSLDWLEPRLEEKDKADARKMLSPLVEQLWSDNITGLFLPDSNLTIPSVGTFIASTRWANQNGLPVKGVFKNSAPA